MNLTVENLDSDLGLAKAKLMECLMDKLYWKKERMKHLDVATADRMAILRAEMMVAARVLLIY